MMCKGVAGWTELSGGSPPRPYQPLARPDGGTEIEDPSTRNLDCLNPERNVVGSGGNRFSKVSAIAYMSKSDVT